MKLSKICKQVLTCTFMHYIKVNSVAETWAYSFITYKIAIIILLSMSTNIGYQMLNEITELFWGELIDKIQRYKCEFKDSIHRLRNSQISTYSPHMFLLFYQSKVGVVKFFLRLRKLGPSWYLLPYRCNACWKPAKSKREIYVTNIAVSIRHIFPIY